MKKLLLLFAAMMTATVMNLQAEDTEAPTNLSADYDDVSYFSAILMGKAYDDSGTVILKAFINGNEVASVTAPSGVETKFKVTGLKQDTEYEIEIQAHDAAGNVCEDTEEVNITTEEAPAPASAPTWDAKKTLSIYSDSYTQGKAWTIASKGQSTVVEEGNLSSTNKALYCSNSDYLVWEFQDGALDGSKADSIHFDVWVEYGGGSIKFSPIWLDGGEQEYLKSIDLESGWNRISLKLDDFMDINKANITAIKWADMPTDCFIDNVYLFGNTSLEVPDMHDFLYFTSRKADGTGTVQLNKKASIETLADVTATFEYSKDRKTWTEYTWGDWISSVATGAAIALNQGDTVFFRALGAKKDGKNATMGYSFNAYFRFAFGADDSIAAGGNTMSLYDAKCEQDTMTEGGFYNLFSTNPSLVSVSELKLPAKKLAKDCYYTMFEKCTSLTTAPELPATALAPYCYNGMFKDCSALTQAPELNATTLAYQCCYQMFQNCTALTVAPALPATKMAERCYACMFEGCTSLTATPELKADSLATLCYYKMFYGCNSLQVDTCADGNCDGAKLEPTHSGTGEPTSWSKNMFENCHGAYANNIQLGGHYCVKEYIEPAKIIVVYNLQGHGEAIKNDTIVTGNKPNKPAKPTAQGYEFRNWYTDAKSLGTAFDFSKTITATQDTVITLYAKWRDPAAWEQFQKDLNTYSYVEYDSTYTTGFMIHLATTQDAQVQPLTDAAFIEASEEVLANYDFRTFTTTIVALYPAMNDELGKCTGVESPSTLIATYTQLPYRANGLNAVCGLYTSYVDLVYKAWAETNYDTDTEICKCMLNSDVFFKGTAKMMEALAACEK